MQSWAIGTVLGVLPVAWLPQLPGWHLPSLLLASAALAWYWKPPLAVFCAALALGNAIAINHGSDLLQRRLAANCVLEPLTVSGVVASLPRITAMPDDSIRQRFEFKSDSLAPQRCRGPARLLLSYYGPEKIIPGARWRFEVKLRKPWGLANPGSFNMQGWFAQTGIDAVGSVRSGRAQPIGTAEGFATVHHRLRLDVSERIEGLSLPVDVRAILRAITVADKSGIDHGLWTLLQHFGINHLLVISGLHVGLVAGAGFLLGGQLQRLLLLRGVTALWLPGTLAMLLASAYAAMAGFSLPTQRALCMLLCFIGANIAGRVSRSSNTLLLAALVVLCLNPLAALGSGFWLSFGAVAALLWLANWQRGMNLVWRLASTHGFMALVMLPVGAWWFGGSSLVAALANFLMIPLVGFVVVPLALLAALAYLLGYSMEQTLWELAAWPLIQLLPIADKAAGGAQNWLYQYLNSSPGAVVIAVVGVLLIVAPVGRGLKAIAVVLMLPLLLPVKSLEVGPEVRTHVTVLDVGQGTAILIRAGRRALLYDTGGGDPAGANMASSVVLPYLRHSGVSRLDTLVVSHPDRDHSAGAGTLLEAIAVDHFYLGQPLPGLAGGQPCIAGQAWRWPGGQTFRFLSPAVESGLASNDASCVLQMEGAGVRLLIPGDIGDRRERELVRYWREELRSDWLLLAHHGSRSSSSPALLKTVRPDMVIINSGYANRFGHPHPEVLKRLEKPGITVFATAAGGALEFEFTPGEPPVVSTYRRRVRRYWM